MTILSILGIHVLYNTSIHISCSASKLWQSGVCLLLYAPHTLLLLLTTVTYDACDGEGVPQAQCYHATVCLILIHLSHGPFPTNNYPTSGSADKTIPFIMKCKNGFIVVDLQLIIFEHNFPYHYTLAYIMATTVWEKWGQGLLLVDGRTAVHWHGRL